MQNPLFVQLCCEMRARCYQANNYGWRVISPVFIYLFVYLFAICVSVFQTLALCLRVFSAAAPRELPPTWRAAAVQLLSWESVKSPASFRTRVNMAAWTPHVPTNTEKPHRRQKSQQNGSDGCAHFCFSPSCSSVWFNRMGFFWLSEE